MIINSDKTFFFGKIHVFSDRRGGPRVVHSGSFGVTVGKLGSIIEPNHRKLVKPFFEKGPWTKNDI